MHLMMTLMVSLLMAFLLMFGNLMLITSWLFASVLSSMLVITFFGVKSLKDLLGRLALGIKPIVMVGGTLAIKRILSRILNAQDDDHISNILRSKFTTYRDFYTDLYTCSTPYGFMGWDVFMKISNTFLIQSAMLAIFLVGLRGIAPLFQSVGTSTNYNLDEKTGTFNKAKLDISPVAAYHIMQLVAFCFMAVIIMR